MARKRRFRRRRKWRPRKMRSGTTVMTKQVFPNRYITTMRYHQNVTLDAGIDHLPASVLFAANNITQPPQAGADHQPMGHDELSGIYNRWVVTSSKIIAVFSNTNTASTQMALITLRDNTVKLTDADRLIENKNVSYGIIDPVGSGNPTRKLTKVFNAGKFFAIKDPTDDDGLVTLFTATPGILAFFHLSVYGLGAGINPTQVNIDVTITYTVTLTSPKPLATS